MTGARASLLAGRARVQAPTAITATGRSVALEGLPLRPAVPRPACHGTGVRAGSVSAVEPAGRVAVGSGVAVHVAPAPSR